MGNTTRETPIFWPFCFAGHVALSLFYSDDDGAPWAIRATVELCAFSLDVRRQPIAQFNRRLGEPNVLEVPAPPRIDLRARDNAPEWDAGAASSLRRPRSGDLIRRGQQDAKRLVHHAKGDHRVR
jgi:hypothetical protein